MKKALFTVFCLCILVVSGLTAPLSAQNSTVIDPDSSLALQTVPFYEGIDVFEQKIQKIRDEEGREPLCLVLCGGSARAFCHTGVLRAMEEQDIVPDFIVANSMGAVIGMLYAYGFSPQKIEDLISKINLSSYFEPVFPLKGGMLSVRRFEALLNQLLGEESHRIEDCAIPILLLTEDLYTKRQIWHASGDFAKIMDAAFAMSVFMEPVRYTLEDGPNAGTRVSLIDSGSIDIAGLKVARRFSSNIMVSTAFYDKDLDFNNPIVIINRTMSIGKERVAIKDILEMEPVLIRNDVEHFSFMDFHKSQEICQAGYTSAAAVMDNIKACPHKKLSQNAELLERRKTTDTLTDSQIERVTHDVPVKLSEPYANLKLWPVFRAVDFPDAYLYDRDGIALDAFVDIPGASFKLRANQPFTFDGLCADALIQFEPSGLFSAELLGSYKFDYKDIKNSSFYALGDINLKPSFFPVWCRSLVVTGEWQTDYLFNTSRLLFTAGFKTLFGHEDDTYLFVKPYFFADRISAGFTPGLGLDLESCWNFAKYAGVGEYAYALYNFTNQNVTLTNRNELYFLSKSPDVTFAECLILRQFKAGAYYTLQADFAKDSQSLNHLAGAFLRTDLSVIGLCSYILEGGCGWNFNEKKVYGSFELKCRM